MQHSLEIREFLRFLSGDGAGDAATFDALGDFGFELGVDVGRGGDVEHRAAEGGGGGVAACYGCHGDFLVAVELGEAFLHPFGEHVVFLEGGVGEAVGYFGFGYARWVGGCVSRQTRS